MLWSSLCFISGSKLKLVQLLGHTDEQITTLSDAEYAEFREWFLNLDAEVWDAKFAADVQAGKLDALSAAARRQSGSGVHFEREWHRASVSQSPVSARATRA